MKHKNIVECKVSFLNLEEAFNLHLMVMYMLVYNYL